jgi:[acyl-carrier-protein] S-malonyltransferase
MADIDSALAFIFPGQGSQAVGMLRDLAALHSEVEHTFAEASRVLGFDLWHLVARGPEQDLNRTENTQPALLAASVAIWRIWSRCSEIRPAWMAGHSLGEYSALVCAGALNFEDAVLLVRERGRLMQQAVPEGTGAMAAILGLDDARVGELCAAVTRPEALVSPANFNAPGQVVVAGHAAAVRRLVDAAKAEGARRSVLLAVSVPSHCLLMEPAAARLESILSAVTIRSPGTPVLHNVDVLPHQSAPEIREALTAQMYRPVRWSETIKAMTAAGATQFIECGPGRVLAGLQRRIAPESAARAINEQESLNNALESVQ